MTNEFVRVGGWEYIPFTQLPPARSPTTAPNRLQMDGCSAIALKMQSNEGRSDHRRSRAIRNPEANPSLQLPAPPPSRLEAVRPRGNLPGEVFRQSASDCSTSRGRPCHGIVAGG